MLQTAGGKFDYAERQLDFVNTDASFVKSLLKVCGMCFFSYSFSFKFVFNG